MNSLFLAITLLISCNFDKTSTETGSTVPHVEVQTKPKKAASILSDSPTVNSAGLAVNSRQSIESYTKTEKREQKSSISEAEIEEKSKIAPRENPSKKIEIVKETVEVDKEPRKTEEIVPYKEVGKKSGEHKVEKTDRIEENKKADIHHDIHEEFSEMLGKYVLRSGSVNYKAFLNDLPRLKKYSELLSNTKTDGMSRADRLSFYINAYNAHTILLILENYPVNSITEIANGKPWDKKWISLEGKTISLNQLENDIIRPQFNEPRIHFAVNCAAVSCPRLWNRAFTEHNLEKSLEALTREFINNQNQNNISDSEVKISRIFEWYASDFGNLKNFLNRYSLEKIPASVEIRYSEYDWSLNGK